MHARRAQALRTAWRGALPLGLAGLLGVLGLLGLLGGGQRDAGAASAPTAAVDAAPTDAQLEQGRKIYNFRCYFCHGYSGDARTLATTYLTPPPRDFTRTAPQALSRAAMLQAVREGRPGTAMKSFHGILSEAEMAAVTDFVRQRFMLEKHRNTAYHTPENGWPAHDRHAAAFPFARGEIPIDRPWEQLNASQQAGKRLFLNACISCHDHGTVQAPGAPWEARPVSFPRDAYCTSCHQDTPGQAPRGAQHPRREATHTFADAAGAVPVRADRHSPGAAYRVHDRAPALPAGAGAQLRQGERLFQRNCAFCHAADGTGKGWIGRFLEPHARDLTDPAVMRGMGRTRLREVINDGLPGSSMPAWRTVLSPAEIEALIVYVDRAFHPLGT